jgi:hypothetical protein
LDYATEFWHKISMQEKIHKIYALSADWKEKLNHVSICKHLQRPTIPRVSFLFFQNSSWQCREQILWHHHDSRVQYKGLQILYQTARELSKGGSME